MCCLIIIASTACKKEKLSTKCYISSIKTNTDSIAFTYNQNNKVSNIKSYFSSYLINMDFVDEGIYHKQIVNTGTASLPNYTINYRLNAKGFVESYEHTAYSSPYTYLNSASNVYDNEGHLIWSKMTTLRDGLPYVIWRDSMIYSNGNLTEYYNFYGNTLHRKAIISYSTIENTIGFYANNDFSITSIVGFSRYYEDERPYICHLLGNGSKNLASSAVVTFPSSPSLNRTYSYFYTFDSQQRISSETMAASPTALGFPKKSSFYYSCR